MFYALEFSAEFLRSVIPAKNIWEQYPSTAYWGCSWKGM